MMERLYPPEAYDRNLALKPTLLLVAIMVYGALPLLLVVLAYNPSPKLQVAFDYLRHYGTPFSLLCGIPAALVLVAWLKRLPSSGAFWRFTWQRGKWLLSISIALHFALLLHQHGHSMWGDYHLSQTDRLVLARLGLDALALYYLWRVRRVSDVFADFPARPKEN